jgi:hypothetical protein
MKSKDLRKKQLVAEKKDRLQANIKARTSTTVVLIAMMMR